MEETNINNISVGESTSEIEKEETQDVSIVPVSFESLPKRNEYEKDENYLQEKARMKRR